MSLYLGISIAMAFEVLEFFVDVFVNVYVHVFGKKSNKKSSGKAKKVVTPGEKWTSA